MPFVIVRGALRIGQQVAATLCDPNVAGRPNRATDVPIQAKLISERTICIDDGEAREIISRTDGNGMSTFLDSGSAAYWRARS